MSSYFFVGDGCEVLAVEAYEVNAWDVRARMQKKTDDALSVYECDPSEICRDDSTADGRWVWAHPCERAIAEKHYDLPTLAECVAQEACDPADVSFEFGNLKSE